METTVDRFGRVVIPKQVRDELALEPGSALSVEASEAGILLRPLDERSCLVVRDGVLVHCGVATGDLTEAVSAHRRERARRLRTRRGRRT